MGKRRFQGYAVGKGFSNIDPGFSSITRLQEKQNQDLANLKQAEKERRNRDLQAEADLQRIMQSEEANRKEINIDQQAFSTRERALVNNRNQAVQNNNAELAKIKQQGDNLQQLIGFSKQAFADYQTIQAKNWEATANDSYQYHMNHGTSLEDQIRQDLLEDKQWSQSQDFEALADQLRADGYTNQEVNYVRGKGNASDYGRLKAYSVKAGEGWSTFAQEQIARMGITDPVKQRQALEALRIKYLKDHKLYGLTSDFLEPMFQHMRKGTQSILDKSIHRQSVAFTQRRSAEALETLATFKTPDSLNNFYLSKTREINPTTGNFFTPAEAKDATFAALRNIDHLSDIEAVTLLEETTHLHMNKTWADANRAQVYDLLNQRRIIRKTREANAKAFDSAKKAEVLRDAQLFLKDPTKYNGDRRVAQKIINELYANGHDPNSLGVLLPYLDQSVQGRADGDYWREWINEHVQNGTLTSEDLGDPNVPQDLKTKYWQQAQTNDKLFASTDMDEVIIPRFKDALRNSLKDFSLEASLHPSFRSALRQAEIEFRKNFLKTQDADAASQMVELQIKNGTGKFMVTVPGQQERNNGVKSFFNSFTPGSHKNAPKIHNVATLKDINKILIRFKDDPTRLSTELLVHPQELKEIAEAFRDGKSYRLPEAFYHISNINPNIYGSPHDIWQQQLKAAEDTGHLEKMNLKIEDFSGTLFRQTSDPLGKKMIQRLRIKQDAAKAIQLRYHPQSTREPRFMEPKVVATVSNQLPIEYQVPLSWENLLSNPDLIQRVKTNDDYDYSVELGQVVPYEVE